jgi:hypothetical protein
MVRFISSRSTVSCLLSPSMRVQLPCINDLATKYTTAVRIIIITPESTTSAERQEIVRVCILTIGCNFRRLARITELNRNERIANKPYKLLCRFLDGVLVLDSTVFLNISRHLYIGEAHRVARGS